MLAKFRCSADKESYKGVPSVAFVEGIADGLSSSGQPEGGSQTIEHTEFGISKLVFQKEAEKPSPFWDGRTISFFLSRTSFLRILKDAITAENGGSSYSEVMGRNPSFTITSLLSAVRSNRRLLCNANLAFAKVPELHEMERYQRHLDTKRSAAPKLYHPKIWKGDSDSNYRQT